MPSRSSVDGVLHLARQPLPLDPRPCSATLTGTVTPRTGPAAWAAATATKPWKITEKRLEPLHTHLIRLPAWHVHASGRTRGSVIDLFSSRHVSSRSLCRNLRLKNPHKTTCLVPLSYCMKTMIPSVRHPRQGIFATAGVRIRTTPSVPHFR
jgi:hypothetical protein